MFDIRGKYEMLFFLFSGVVSMLTSVRVDRLYDKKVKWQENLRDPESEDYQQLSYEASQAVSKKSIIFTSSCFHPPTFDNAKSFLID